MFKCRWKECIPIAKSWNWSWIYYKECSSKTIKTEVLDVTLVVVEVKNEKGRICWQKFESFENKFEHVDVDMFDSNLTIVWRRAVSNCQGSRSFERYHRGRLPVLETFMKFWLEWYMEIKDLTIDQKEKDSKLNLKAIWKSINIEKVNFIILSDKTSEHV